METSTFCLYKWKLKAILFILDSVKSFISMELKRLKVIEFFNKLELKRDYCIKIRNGTNLLTFADKSVK